MSTAPATVHPDVAKNPRDARRAALGSYLGATLEFYDFVIFGVFAGVALISVALVLLIRPKDKVSAA